MDKSKKYSFLVVDDEFPIIKIISDILTIHPSVERIYNAQNGIEGFDVYKNNFVDFVITDILMPQMSGIELIKKLIEFNPDAQIIVVSAFSDIDLVREAMRSGAYDYILKPFSIDDMMTAINRIIERKEFVEERKHYVHQLEEKIAVTTSDLRGKYLSTLSTLVFALEARDRYTHDHSQNVSRFSIGLGKAIGLPASELSLVQEGGILHDIGKIGVPDSILLKPAALTSDEYEVIKQHPTIGKNIVFPALKEHQISMDVVYYHHERFDGKGYPTGLKGDKIPFHARIAAIADAFDAMTSKRIYRSNRSIDEAIEEIKACKETHFDPELAEQFINNIDIIYRENGDEIY
ncbi:MAG: response regulator [Brevinematales bacterium]|nr:response regulator [Brevinematales bacterium]